MPRQLFAKQFKAQARQKYRYQWHGILPGWILSDSVVACTPYEARRIIREHYPNVEELGLIQQSKID